MRIILSSIFLALFFSTSLLAQDYGKIDSLSSLLRQTDTIVQANILNQIGWEYRLSYPDSTLYYCRRVLLLNSDKFEETKAMNFIGIAYMYKGNYAEAFRYHREALDYTQQIGDSVQAAHAYNNLGRLFFTQGDMIKAYDYFIEALKIFEQIGDATGIGYCYQSLMKLYKLQNNKAKALEMLQKTLAIRQQAGDAHGQISTLKELSLFFEEDNNFEKAHQYLFEARAIGDSINDKISTAEIDLALAELHLHQKDYKAAMDFNRKALIAAGVSNNKSILSSIYLNLAQNYFARHAYDNARIYLRKVIEFSEKTGNLKNKQESFYYLSKIYENKEDFKRALFYHQQYLLAKDSLYNTDVALTIERLENRLAIEEKEKEYELLKAAEARNQALIKQERIKNVTKSIIIILVLILLLVLFTFYQRIRLKNKLLLAQKDQIINQNREIIKQNLKIQEQNEDLLRHNEKLAELDKEKTTLMGIVAHDLKAPFNRISGLYELLLLGVQDPAEQDKYTQLIKEASEDGIELIRDLLDANAFEHFNKLNFSEVELNSFLQDLAQNYQLQAASKSIQMHLSVQDGLCLHTEALYLTRILDNLISNAIKYSQPNANVFIQAYTAVDHQVKIAVKDEGPGFSEEDKKYLYQKFRKLSARPTKGESSHGLGLAIVKTLVTRLEANIELISEPKQGSEFVITFPAYKKEMV